MATNVKPVAPKAEPALDTAKVKELLTLAVSEAEFKGAIRAAELVREALKLLG